MATILKNSTDHVDLNGIYKTIFEKKWKNNANSENLLNLL